MAERSFLDKVSRFLESLAKAMKGPHKVASGAVVAAIFGGLMKATTLTETFPHPADTVGNIILFLAVLVIVADIAKGGLYD